MSRHTAVVTGLVGALVGALAGIPYLSRYEECAGLGSQSVQCTMNSTLGPFLSAIAVGVVIAILLGNGVAMITRRSLAPKRPEGRTSLDAVEIDDPATQIAAWGMPPGAAQRTVSLSKPVAYRSRRTPSARPTGAGRGGAGYGAARMTRAARMAGNRV